MDKETPATPAAATQPVATPTPTPAAAPVSPAPAAPPVGEQKKEPVFTQDQLDAIVQKRVAREKEQSSEQVAAAVKAEQDKANQQLEEANRQLSAAQQAAQNVAFASAVTIDAVKAGVAAENIEAFARLISIDDVKDEAGAVSGEKVASAVAAVLAKFPGLAGVQQRRVGGVPLSSPETPALSLSEAIAKRFQG